ncbi:hypothetical protein F5144DRAFT_617760 [Chaetomium tenue]|uniref:Uncharacterized protein n=1 Tax=Chaetomium tenue TaxID=1854479 RepID=A0ACB7PRU5_9PEZI|nr:hypothetical protein F5144DRAFT_617760 [Chaetomium globosum]
MTTRAFTVIEPTEGPSQRRSQRGRGMRKGQSRRPRGLASSGEASEPGPVQPASAIVATPAVAVAVAPAPAPEAGNQPGRGRRGQGGSRGGSRRGGSRRGTGQRSVVVSHRGGRRPPSPHRQGGNNGPRPNLSATAAEFVPGQPIQSSGAEPSESGPRTIPVSEEFTAKSTAPDLTTRIHEDIDRCQYECVICTGEVLRTSEMWSCSICWTTIHLFCAQQWYTSQLQLREDFPGNYRGADDDWRCPGCNSGLVGKPEVYHCWCGKETDPKPIAGLPPHTCGQTCSKPRAACPHPCSLMCHAGPCPPCTMMGPAQSCFCGKHTSTKKCRETDYGKDWSCQEICGDLFACGEHSCTQSCHSGLCGSCDIPTPSVCYCGREQREIPCSQRGDVLESFNHGQAKLPSGIEQNPDQWFEGSFRCTNICGRPFDCGHHLCSKPCHSQDEAAAHCPLSPDVVTHCSCGKTSLASMSVQPRQSCQDPIPHCNKPCNKAQPCGHLCLGECHTGPCAPCTQIADIPCRCGRVTTKSLCHQGNISHPQCFRICKAQLNCGRHECGEHCCPGEKVAAERRKHKRTANENYEPEHICFQPPQPCGTRSPECHFACTRASPCGHPSGPHLCHTDETPCPKCPYLMSKPCVCGKKSLRNQPCWFDEGRCGLPCGKKLKCGAHECRKPCHRPGECEDAGISGSHCPQRCGKVRKSCEHTCVDQCHAPDACKEDKPCQSKTFVTCPCQHCKQEVRCQATALNPSPAGKSTLACDDECRRLQRNRKLAQALDIDPSTHADEHIPYSDTSLRLFRENVSWAQTQERQLRVFAAAPEEKRIRFKPMPPHQRAFLHALAEDFGLDSESQDPGPHRHVCVFKTPRFVSAPGKTLGQCLQVADKAAKLRTGVSAITPKSSSSPRRQGPPFNAFLKSSSSPPPPLPPSPSPPTRRRSRRPSPASSPPLRAPSRGRGSPPLLCSAASTMRRERLSAGRVLWLLRMLVKKGGVRWPAAGQRVGGAIGGRLRPMRKREAAGGGGAGAAGEGVEEDWLAALEREEEEGEEKEEEGVEEAKGEE